MINSTELKPCPFCGEKEDLHPTDGWFVKCGGCGCTAGSEGKPIDRQIKYWNERHCERPSIWHNISNKRRDNKLPELNVLVLLELNDGGTVLHRRIHDEDIGFLLTVKRYAYVEDILKME